LQLPLTIPIGSTVEAYEKQGTMLLGVGRSLMPEPRLEDDIAYYGYERCDECGDRHDPEQSHAGDGEPDRMWGDED
jgi:hypothetical protein